MSIRIGTLRLSSGAVLACAFALGGLTNAAAAPMMTVYSTVTNLLDPAQIAFSNPVCTVPFSNTPNGFFPCGASDNFGAVVTSQITVTTGGLSTFTVGSDDGSYLYVDGALVVNNGFFQGLTQRSGTVNLAPGLHTLMVQYFQGGGGAGLTVTLPSGTFYSDGGVMTGTAYRQYTYSSNPAAFAFSDPACAFVLDSVNFPDNPGFSPCGLADNFAAVMNGTFSLANPGSYAFATTSDDGSYLFIDGNLVVDNGFFQGMTRRSGTANLTAGLHTFELRYFQGGGGSGLIAEFPSDAAFVALPEPSAGMLTLCGIVAGLVSRRRRGVRVRRVLPDAQMVR